VRIWTLPILNKIHSRAHIK